MLKLLTTLCSLFLFGCCLGQNYLLKEDFDNNNNEWPFIATAETYDNQIKNGHLEWRNKSTGYQSSYFFTNEDWNKNFKITMRLKLASGRKNNLIGLYFSSNQKRTHYYRFGISDNGSWRVDAVNDEGTLINSGWIKSSAIKSGEYNELEIRKLGNNTFFSINGVTVDFQKDLKEIGKYIAVSTCDSSHVLFDYVYVEETNEEKKALQDALEKYFDQLKFSKTILNETFDDNTLGWSEGDDKEYFADIKDGTLMYANKSNTQSRSTIVNASELNWSLDFTIQTSIKRNSGTNNNIYGMLIGYNDWDNYHGFGFSPNGYWKALGEDKKTVTYSSGWKKTELVNANDYNLLTIEKVGDQLAFFINDKPVAVGYAAKRTGGNVGFWLTSGAICKADFYKVTSFYRSEKEQENRIKEITSKLENVK